MGTQTCTTPPPLKAVDRHQIGRRARRCAALLLLVLALVLPTGLAGDVTRPALAATVGGKDMGISLNFTAPNGVLGLDLTWTGGDLQNLYQLVVWTQGGSTVDVFLDRARTSFQDTDGGFRCYVLLPLANGPVPQVLGRSDMLCGQVGFFAQPSLYPPPANFTLRLNQSSTASLSWVNAPGTYALLLVVLPFDGSPPRYRPLGYTATSATDETGGAATCYALLAGTNAGTSHTDGWVCGVPGVSASPADTTAAARTAGTEQVGATAERIRPQVRKLGPKMQAALQEAKQRLDRMPRR